MCVCVCVSNFSSIFKGFVNYISVVISIMLLLFQITFILVKWLLLFQVIFSQKMFSDQVCKQKAACRTYHKVANFHLLQKTICCYTCYVRHKRCPQGLDFLVYKYGSLRSLRSLVIDVLRFLINRSEKCAILMWIILWTGPLVSQHASIWLDHTLIGSFRVQRHFDCMYKCFLLACSWSIFLFCNNLTCTNDSSIQHTSIVLDYTLISFFTFKPS